ncbi:MAG: TonB-dependent receptor [Microbacter sp.]
MKIAKILFSIFLLTLAYQINAQNAFKVVLKDDQTKEPIIGAAITIDSLRLGAVTDEKGIATLANIPDGDFRVQFRSIGYTSRSKIFHFPQQSSNKIIEITLEPSSNSLDEVVVSITRSNRSIENIPIKVDVVSAEDVSEKGLMQPSNIASLFNETTGVMAQQTSLVTGATSLHMMGLPGRYTTMLNDGMPLYQGYSGGLSIVQIAPMNLQQVEFIKGNASTLYGGGAIGGVVNLITRKPQTRPALSFLLNGTTTKGWDASEFYAQKWNKAGVTIFSTYDHSSAYDPDHTGFSVIPQMNRFTFNPTLFLYFNRKTSAWVGINSSFEHRLGGDMKVLEGRSDSIHQFFQRNNSTRLSTQFSLNHQWNDHNQLNVKNSVSYFGNNATEPNFNVEGREISTFTEINNQWNTLHNEWIAGLNLWTDHYRTLHQTMSPYQLVTLSGFIQNTWSPLTWFSMESGLRFDQSNVSMGSRKNQFFVLPSINLLAKINHHWNSRIGGGLGYKMPSPFGFETEETLYDAVLPIQIAQSIAERSYGGTWDVMYQTVSDELKFNVDVMLFATRINHPLIEQNNALFNANGYLQTEGSATAVSIAMDELNLFAGYTYTLTQNHYNGQTQWQPLSPKNLLYLDLAYEDEGNFRTGIEADYTSRQALYDGSIGRPTFVVGWLIEKMWKHINVFLNIENITNVRQSKWGALYTGSISHPVFKDVYAPLEGRVANIGIQIHL